VLAVESRLELPSLFHEALELRFVLVGPVVGVLFVVRPRIGDELRPLFDEFVDLVLAE
jgi:hypothetical protein